MRRRADEETRQRAIARYLDGEDLLGIAKAAGVTDRTILIWVRDALGDGGAYGQGQR